MTNEARVEPDQPVDRGVSSGEPGDRARREERMRNLAELVATVLLAMATVLTAWSVFEANKWSGTQAIHFAQASALRTNSAKAASAANAEEVIDVDTFVSWAAAFDRERRANPTASTGPNGAYKPNPKTLSGFLFLRFRPEFRTAVDAWLALRPLQNPQAPSTRSRCPSTSWPPAKLRSVWRRKQITSLTSPVRTTSGATITSLPPCCSPRCCSSPV